MSAAIALPKQADRFTRKKRVPTVDKADELRMRSKLLALGDKVEIITITPKLAEQMLSTMVVNRILRNEWVEAYARDMKNEEWALNGSCIVFSREGEVPDYDSPGGKKLVPAGSLLDGQHRLWACVDSGTSFRTLVVYGVDPVVFHTIDSGVTRKPSDMMLGEKYTNDLSAALRILWVWKKNGLLVGANATRITRKELLQVLDKNPNLRDAVSKAAAINAEVKLMPRSTLAFFLYVFSSKDAALGQEFIEKLHSGEGIHKSGRTAPIFALRNRLIKLSQRTSRHPLVERQASVIKAWNLLRSGAQACPERALIWNRYGANPERFPEIK